MSDLARGARAPVVFFVNGLGDHLLALPALRALASLFPGRLTLVCAPGMADLFFSGVPFARVVEWAISDARAPGDEATVVRSFDARGLAAEIGECDLFLSLVPWHSTSLTELLALLRPARSVGFFASFDVALPRDYSKHAADLAFDLPKYFAPALELEELAAPPELDAEAWAAASRVRGAIPGDTRVLVVHADTGGRKMWRPDALVRALGLFLERHADFVVLVVGGEAAPALDQGADADRIFMAVGLPLDVSFCLVAMGDLFLGVDSCMLHAADLFRVPGVGLFGPTRCGEFGFRLAKHEHVSGDGTLDGIAPLTVAGRLERLLLPGGDPPALAAMLGPEAIALVGRVSGKVPLLDELRDVHLAQWAAEDQARSRLASAEAIADVKRRIDDLNARRHRLIDRFDVTLAGAPVEARGGVLYSETAGELCDRLIILSLKLRSAEGTAADRSASPDARALCAGKLPGLRAWQAHLRSCLARLLGDMARGLAVVAPRAEFKMYNDPSLNPVVRGECGRAPSRLPRVPQLLPRRIPT